ILKIEILSPLDRLFIQRTTIGKERKGRQENEINSQLKQNSSLKLLEERFGRSFLTVHWKDIKKFSFHGSFLHFLFEDLPKKAKTSWIDENWKDLFELMLAGEQAGI